MVPEWKRAVLSPGSAHRAAFVEGIGLVYYGAVAYRRGWVSTCLGGLGLFVRLGWFPVDSLIIHANRFKS